MGVTCMAIYRKMPFSAGEARPGELELAQASSLLRAEAFSWPR